MCKSIHEFLIIYLISKNQKNPNLKLISYFPIKISTYCRYHQCITLIDSRSIISIMFLLQVSLIITGFCIAKQHKIFI